MSLIYDSYGAFLGLRDWLTATIMVIVLCTIVFGFIFLMITFGEPSQGIANIQTLSCFELHDVITEAGETEYTYRNVSGSWEKISAVYGAKCK